MNNKVVFCFHTIDHEFNLGVGFVAAAVKARGYPAELVMFREIKGGQHDAVEDIVAKILEKNPTVVAFSVMTLNWPRIREVAKALRQRFAGLIVVGGYHAVTSPADIAAEPAVDVVCLGEGEQPLLALLEQYRNIGQREFAPVEGLFFTATGDIARPGPGWLVEELDEYPYMDYQIFDDEGDKPLRQKGTGMLFHGGIFSLSVITGRGCPYKCTYCANTNLIDHYGGLKRYLRKYSPEAAVANVKMIAEKFSPQFIEFMDETFSLNRNWTKEFCTLYKKEVGKPFLIMTRIDRVDEETVAVMADSGLKVVLIGLECGDEEYRIKRLNRKMSNATIKKGAGLLKKYGVSFVTFNMFGMPFETRETIARTYELNAEIEPDVGIPFHYAPFPGTELTRMAYEANMVMPVPEKDWDYCTPMLNTPELPAEEVAQMIERFRQRFTNGEAVGAFYQKMRDAARAAAGA